MRKALNSSWRRALAFSLSASVLALTVTVNQMTATAQEDALRYGAKTPESIEAAKSAAPAAQPAATTVTPNVGESNNQAVLPPFTEGFDDVTTLPSRGWFLQNNSVPVGTTGWFQGSTVFPAQGGPATSYIGANFNNTTGTNTISNWLLTPTTTFSNGDQIKFYTRTVTGSPFPDRLEVRLSTAGASTNVGTGPTGIGDFTTVLLTVNPDLAAGGYPEAWTQFTVTIAGLSAPTSGRVGFRYFVTSGGPTGDNSNFIGIDTFEYTTGTPPAVVAKQCFDFFGSGRTSFATARAEGNTFRWSLQNNGGTGSESVLYGLTTDLPTPGYFDGDNRADLNVWRNGTYFLRPSTAPTTFVGIQWGQTGDIAGREADYDGDGRDDPTVVRNIGGSLVWYYLRSGNGTLGSFAFGSAATDTPIAGADYNGDGRADVTVIRNNPAGTNDVYYVADTTTGALILAQPWGEIETDAYVIGDYLGDTKADFAVWRGKGAGTSGTWYIKENGGTGSIGAQWGIGGAAGSRDLPLCGDYNGDGKSDVAVYRQSNATYYWLNSGVTTSVGIQQFGQAGDLPFAALRAY